MQSFLITAKDKNKASSYISDFLKEKEIYPIDVNQQVYEKAMGIEDVRSIQKKILLKPFRGKTKAIVIQVYENITTEAQNALLKILEEPPANTIIVISIQKKEFLLSTIVSRCKVIELKEKEISLIDEDLLELSNTLNILLNGKIGDKLKVAQDIAKDKDEIVLWLEKISVFVRKKLIENYNDLKYLNLLRLLTVTHTIIKSTNVNQRTALENLFLSFNP